MLVANLWEIIEDHYISSIEASSYAGWKAKAHVVFLFVIIPLSIGIPIGYLSPIWGGMLQILITVLGVLTGFSINSLVLLMRHSKDNSYPLATDIVIKTRDFSLYAILVGLTLIVVSLIGFAFSNSPVKFGNVIKILSSIILYSLVVHYFMTFAVITHRFYTVVHGDAINN